MRVRTFVVAAIVLGLAPAAGLLRGDADAEATKRIADLVNQLGDDDYDKREAASKELEAVGEPALVALRKAAADNADLEIRWRAVRSVEAIRYRLDRTDVKSVPPPRGAVVLFDGKSLNGWVGRDGKTAAAWKVYKRGFTEVRGGDIRTRQTFSGAYKLHVEFRVPDMPEFEGQDRGNSGVFLNGRYEVQILDSYGLRPEVKSCGAIYGVAAPLVSACKVVEVWQSFDIEFHPPRFEGASRVEGPRITVYHNGVLIHDNIEVRTDDTGNGLPHPPAEPGPILLQDHDCPVQFRNLWLLPLAKD
jgi:hypothetical protein